MKFSIISLLYLCAWSTSIIPGRPVMFFDDIRSIRDALKVRGLLASNFARDVRKGEVSKRERVAYVKKIRADAQDFDAVRERLLKHAIDRKDRRIINIRIKALLQYADMIDVDSDAETYSETFSEEDSES